MRQLDRKRLVLRSLAERHNRVFIRQDRVDPAAVPRALAPEAREAVARAAADIRAARGNDRSVMLTFGAHSIKNGLAPVLTALLKDRWCTHLATNGAGVIHDWEIAYQGSTSEDVAANVKAGQFGLWDETGRAINLALAVGAYRGLGYGESVSALIADDGVEIPSLEALAAEACATPNAGAADLYDLVKEFAIPAGKMRIEHPFKSESLFYASRREGVPLTAHPMFGHDIIYTHPWNRGACVGRTAERDFLAFAAGVARLGGGGVYLSVGSAVMSPMVFEKSLSMAKNLALQSGTPLEGYRIYVVDLAPSAWDWKKGEPPEHNPAYYLRYAKTFSRMGGEMTYIQADNRDFLLGLLHALMG